MQPTSETDRIESLDELRGFALLGILLLNILGFGLPSAAYSNPGFDLSGAWGADLIVWAAVELFAEGAMRGLFSMLFGAGVVLFLGGGNRSGALHYRRTFWLLAFGLFDAYLLLWSGDILISYAIAGAILYWVRNLQARTLLIICGVLVLLMSLMHLVISVEIGGVHDSARLVERTEDPQRLEEWVRQQAGTWYQFSADYFPTEDALQAELAQRRDSYLSAFHWNAVYVTEFLMFVLPVFLLWDALAAMMLGMALFKLGVLQGGRSDQFYRRLMLIGFGIGLPINLHEVWSAIAADMELTEVFAQMQWTYDIGRLGMTLGYTGLLLWLSQTHRLHRLRRLLAATGRMALTNYLGQSFICLFLFTGAGFALVGEIDRAGLYPIVFAIWLFQLWFSRWWLERFRFGPLEWLWRALTYGTLPQLRRSGAQ